MTNCNNIEENNDLISIEEIVRKLSEEDQTRLYAAVRNIALTSMKIGENKIKAYEDYFTCMRRIGADREDIDFVKRQMKEAELQERTWLNYFNRILETRWYKG